MAGYPQRINNITDLLVPCRTLADIGCDHAYVCIKAVKDGKAETAFACDVHTGPLARAKENIEKEGLSSRITVVLSDRFHSLEASPDAASICGMGGLLIRDILKACPEKLVSLRQIVLGPHSEVPELRKYVQEESGFDIRAERVVFEQGKFYVLMDVRKADPCCRPWSPEEYITGKPSLQLDKACYRTYVASLMEKTEQTLKKIRCDSDSAEKRSDELKRELSLYRKTYEHL